MSCFGTTAEMASASDAAASAASVFDACSTLFLSPLRYASSSSPPPPLVTKQNSHPAACARASARAPGS